MEILRIPTGTVEMTLEDGNVLDKIRNIKGLDVETECFAFSKEKQIIYINLNFHSQFTQYVFVEKFKNFCDKINVVEICIIIRDNNALFIKF